MTHTIFFPHKHPGFLRISGEDRLDFLQRQTTNDLQMLDPGKHLSTVLTNPAARILDVLQVFHETDQSLGAVTLPGREAATALFLKKRIFFLDKVKIEALGEGRTMVDVEGESCEETLGALGLPAPEMGTVTPAAFDGQPLWVLGQEGPGGRGARLLAHADLSERLLAALEAAGAVPLTPEAYDALRITAGLPGPDAELTETYTPLEVGLEALISDTKGCYTGQEIIARQITYDKITRRLVGLRLEGPASAGANVLAEGSKAGTLTSYANTARHGAISLAVLKRPYFEPGTKVVVEGGGATVEGVVAGIVGESAAAD